MNQKGPDCSELCAHEESLEMALKIIIIKEKPWENSKQKNLMFSNKDCHSFYMEVELVRAKWKWERCCPGSRIERGLQKRPKRSRGGEVMRR